MVYIQAESFENGDSSLYGPEKFIDRDLVIVTFNYRLGLLGMTTIIIIIACVVISLI